MSGPPAGQAPGDGGLHTYRVPGGMLASVQLQKLQTVYTPGVKSEQMFVDLIQMRFLHWRR